MLPPNMAQPSILLVGNCQRHEMSPIRDWINSLGQQASVRQTRKLSSDTLLDAPDFVIICQSWPDEFSATEVSAALGRWPLALWVCCYGAWCDSDGRTRTIWPISVRVPAGEAAGRLQHAWRILAEQQSDPLPLTASRDEAFEFDHCHDAASLGNADGDQPIACRQVVEKSKACATP